MRWSEGCSRWDGGRSAGSCAAGGAASCDARLGEVLGRCRASRRARLVVRRVSRCGLALACAADGSAVRGLVRRWARRAVVRRSPCGDGRLLGCSVLGGLRRDAPLGEQPCLVHRAMAAAWLFRAGQVVLRRAMRRLTRRSVGAGRGQSTCVVRSAVVGAWLLRAGQVVLRRAMGAGAVLGKASCRAWFAVRQQSAVQLSMCGIRSCVARRTG